MAEKNDDYAPKEFVDQLAANLNHPDKFAEIFCKAAESQKSIDDVLRKTISNLIKNDRETRDSLKQQLDELDRQAWRTVAKKYVEIIKAFSYMGLSAILTTLITKYVS